MKIAIDFDGTCVRYAYPSVGNEIGAVPVLEQLSMKGHQLILYTMRTGKELDEAVRWFEFHEIPLYGVQFDPDQKAWTSSNKCYAHLYIDDAALGIPLIQEKDEKKPYVDWKKIEELLIEKGFL